MSGLYLHIPFCKSRCAYCDFFSTTRAEKVESFVEALCREVALRSHELDDTHISSIYFGGGTPSQLSVRQFRRILHVINDTYHLSEEVELTIEMNPGDQPPLGATDRDVRISLGIQTFSDDLLRLIRRRHDAATAIATVRSLQAAGVRNISIDLIYGLPGQTLEQWEHDLKTAFSLGVQHISAYALSYEEGTALTRMRDEGQLREATDEESVAMYQLLCRYAREAGFEHYEISNFARPGFRSRHNSSYWTGQPYLGFGPGAHSFDGHRTRRENLPDLDRYLQELLAPEPTMTEGITWRSEVLTDIERYDEAVMCGLRTRDGILLSDIAARFGAAQCDFLLRQAAPYLRTGQLVQNNGRLHLSEAAIMTSDAIMSDLMANER